MAGKRAKVHVFTDEGIVLIFCPRINACTYFCSTYKKYDRQGFDIVCLNPDFHRESDVDRILTVELGVRSELKNRIG